MQVPLGRFEFKDIAIKVVGVGSVGTACWVLLLMADDKDPLFLQVKEARTSVLEAYAGKSVFSNHGQRVVNGFRLMQSASDIFLGWCTSKRRATFLYPTATRHKVETEGGGVQLDPDDPVRRILRLDAGARPRPQGRTGNDQRLPGQQHTFDKAIAAFSIASAD